MNRPEDTLYEGIYKLLSNNTSLNATFAGGFFKARLSFPKVWSLGEHTSILTLIGVSSSSSKDDVHYQHVAS